MKISTKGRYALRVMIDLALNSDGNFIALKEIAKRQDITVKYLEQIVALLNKAGFLETARGLYSRRYSKSNRRRPSTNNLLNRRWSLPKKTNMQNLFILERFR